MSEPSLPVLADLSHPGAAPAGAGGSILGRLEQLAPGAGCVLVAASAGLDATEVAVGLATSAAGGGRRVVLIECDLARPGLAGRLRLTPAPGISEYLSWQAEAPQILQPVAVGGAAGAGGQLVCIVAGAPSADPVGLLASDSFPHAISKVRKAYDLVLLLGGLLLDPEMHLLYEHADAVALCVGAGETAGPAAQRIDAARGRLSRRPTGLVLLPA